MKKLSKLFYECAYKNNYSQIGNSVNYKYVEDKNHLYIYFEGSNSSTDWMRNFMFKKRPYKDMEIPYKVHRGFLSAWKEAEDTIIEKILERDLLGKTGDSYKWTHITIIGYSHGGALAFFAHECVWFWRPDLRENGFETYVFEGPRVFGGFKIPKNLKERWASFTLVRTNNDIVTHVPPKLFRFCHAGNILKITGDTRLVQNKLPKCIKSHYPQVVYDALLKYENN